MLHYTHCSGWTVWLWCVLYRVPSYSPITMGEGCVATHSQGWSPAQETPGYLCSTRHVLMCQDQRWKVGQQTNLSLHFATSCLFNLFHNWNSTRSWLLTCSVPDTQLECLAGWREGRHRYLVVKMEDNHRTVDEDKYRCIMWDQVEEEGETKIFLSISQDASCNSLFSTREGRALVLYPG